jgi:hypothetical protein
MSGCIYNEITIKGGEYKMDNIECKNKLSKWFLIFTVLLLILKLVMGVDLVTSFFISAFISSIIIVFISLRGPTYN